MNQLKEKMHHTKLLKRPANPNKKRKKHRVSNHPITPFPDQKQKRELEFPEVA